MNILFSILIPAFKKKYLKEAIDSCLKQTYQNWELVIVDDASPENLKSVADDYLDDRIRYYRNEKNCGAVDVVDNWNICLSYAKGDYIICMGDDDRLLPCCLEEYEKLIRQYPKIDVFHAWTEIIDANGDVISMQEPRPLFESSYSMLYNRFRFDRIQYIGDWLFRTQKLKGGDGFYKLPYAWGSDDMTVFLTAQENGILNSQIPLFQYRVNTLTISNSGNDEMKILALSEMEHAILIELKNCKPSSKLDGLYIRMLTGFTHKYIQDRIFDHLINYFKLNTSVSQLLKTNHIWNNYLSKSQIAIAYIRAVNKKIKQFKLFK